MYEQTMRLDFVCLKDKQQNNTYKVLELLPLSLL
jgi:hypothetical protein